MPGQRKQTASWSGLDDLPLPVKKALKNMEIGDFSEVIEVPPFYQIVKLNERQEGRIKNFSQVKEMIRIILSRDKYQSLLKEYISNMRSSASVKINESVLKKFTQKVKNGS